MDWICQANWVNSPDFGQFYIIQQTFHQRVHQLSSLVNFTWQTDTWHKYVTLCSLQLLLISGISEVKVEASWTKISFEHERLFLEALYILGNSTQLWNTCSRRQWCPMHLKPNSSLTPLTEELPVFPWYCFSKTIWLHKSLLKKKALLNTWKTNWYLLIYDFHIGH